MTKLGYLFPSPLCKSIEADRQMMLRYGCSRIVEESADDEASRPGLLSLLDSISEGDELVVSRFSNAVRSLRQLAVLLEFSQAKSIRIISINDRIDTAGTLFPDTSVKQVLTTFRTLNSEAFALRKTYAQLNDREIGLCRRKPALSSKEREIMVVTMYREGHNVKEIMHSSGFRSRSSVYRILRKHNLITTTESPKADNAASPVRADSLIPIECIAAEEAYNMT